MTDAKYVKKAPRQSNLELSRILAMYLIVMHHFSVHGGVPIWSGSAPLSFNFYLDQLLSTGGKIGVNLFVLITGYFLAKKFSKFSSLIYLWIKTFSYVIVFSCSFALLAYIPSTGVLWSVVFFPSGMISIGLFLPISFLSCFLRLLPALLLHLFCILWCICFTGMSLPNGLN